MKRRNVLSLLAASACPVENVAAGVKLKLPSLGGMVQTLREEALGPVPSGAAVAGAPFLHAGPMIGHTTESSALIWMKASNASSCAVRIGQKEDLSDARTVAGAALMEAGEFTGVVEVKDLQPGTRYYYAPVLEAGVALSHPLPSFVTASTAGGGGRLRVALASCVGRRGYYAAAAFGEMAERLNFDLLLMLGDNHYGDTTDPAVLRDFYLMQRNVQGFSRIVRSVPTYAIWDDHDYGPNNSDGTQPGKEDSLRVFRQWWANPGYGEPENPGCYYQFQRNGVDFFMLDGRYHRTPNKSPEDGKKTMLGARQLAWLKAGLSASKAKYKVIACGSEWQTKTQPDGWSSFARERQEIFDHLTSGGIEGVVLVSGDRHFTAGYQVQGRFVELTSGPIGSLNATLKENPERFTGADEGKLWMIAEFDTGAGPANLTYEIWQAGGGLLERRELSADELNGRGRIALSHALMPLRMEKKDGR